ncbi:hypothetical protein E1A91_D07G211900v1 [Gossypium mustelinum]|uniref:Rapid ALkalinization Factor n=1 Tax=Gossypium mustelinum TaxID=34275 RepID=A0A5D2UAM2_GOSMU|nr:hypothetical protein E1A91_D07G211900v1 [Gossypium mustelinum]
MMTDQHHYLKRPSLHRPILLLMLMVMIPWSTSHFALDPPEKRNSLGFFHCNGSSAECFGGKVEDDMLLEFLVESETRRMLQQGGNRPSTNTLKPNIAACGRDKYGYLCTPPSNKDVKRSENCGGDNFNRACHQLSK